MNCKKLRRITAFALAAGLAAGTISASFDNEAAAAVIIQPGVNIKYNTGTSGSSPDAADYAATGGAAQGSMSISTYVPSGCIASMSMETSDPIVVTKDNYGYSDMSSDLAKLKAKYSSRMNYRSLGTTADGRNIYEVTVGNTNAGTHILITASTHAREFITTLLVMEQLEYMLQYAGNGAFDGKSLSSWLNDVCVHFVPMVNPDGVTVCQQGIDGIRSQTLKDKINEAYANDTAAGRTTLDFDSYLKRWKANANGVNINDNFNALTSKIEKKTDSVSSESYYGTPGSEAETKALQSLVDSRHFKAVINYHATGSVIYWDYTGNPLKEHCRDLANNVKTLTGYTMVGGGDEGGSFKTYLGTRSQPVTNITVEVGTSQAPVDIAEFNAIWAQNKFVPYYTMKWAKEKGK